MHAPTLDVTLHRLLRRYEPAMIALGVMVVVVQLVPPLREARPPAVAVAPFSGPLPQQVVAGEEPDIVAETPAAASDAEPPALDEPAVAPAAPAAPSAVVQADRGRTAPPAATIHLFARHPAPGGAGGLAVAQDATVYATLVGERPLLAHHAAGGSRDRVLALSSGSNLSGALAGRGGSAYVLSTEPASVLAVDLATGRATTHAAVPDVAPCVPVARERDCDASAVDRAPVPWALAADAKGNLFVTDVGQGAIWRVDRRGRIEQWVVDRSFSRVDRPSGPTGIAIDGAGNVVFAVPSTLTEDAGRVYLQAVRDDGSPGARRTLASLDAGERPAGLALSRAGRVYVTLPDGGQVLVLGRDGTVVRRITVDRTYEAGTLTGLAFQGTNLLVAGRGAILRIPVGEPGGTVHPG